VPKGRFQISVLGGLLGFVTAGLAAAYAKLLIDDRDLLVIAIAGGAGVFVALFAIDVLSEWIERRNRRPPA
jgi:hypothetical protein